MQRHSRTDRTTASCSAQTEAVCFLQSVEIREPSKVRTQGSISSHLKEQVKEGGKQEKRRRGDVLFYF